MCTTQNASSACQFYILYNLQMRSFIPQIHLFLLYKWACVSKWCHEVILSARERAHVVRLMASTLWMCEIWLDFGLNGEKKSVLDFAFHMPNFLYVNAFCPWRNNVPKRDWWNGIIALSVPNLISHCKVIFVVYEFSIRYLNANHQIKTDQQTN